ncbi:MAG: hypothetical protein IPM46_02605 [Flavobacteriales bacterium]|nr:hypothetical protein [Flavobacteriales bacterium]
MRSASSASKLWPGIGFVISAAVLGLFVGGFLGKASVAKSDGLAGAATVLGYAVLGVALGAIVAIILARRMARGLLVRVLLVIGPLALIMLGWSTKRFLDQKAQSDEQWEQEQERMRNMKPTPVLFASLDGAVDPSFALQSATRALGMGMVSPRLEPGVLRFYAMPDLDQTPDHAVVSDSLVFVQGDYHVEIAYAPPWFVPAHLKLDYDLLLMRATTVALHWVEAEVNSTDGRTMWISRSDAGVVLWQDFLLSVVAVEILDPSANPIRLKPLEHAAVLADGADALLKPLAVRGDWLMVSTNGLADRIVPTGWIRWRDGEKLLVDYSLLC